MSRSTHNRHTQNQKEPSKIHVKTNNSILKSLDVSTEQIGNITDLSERKEEIVGDYKTIEHFNNLENQSSIIEILKVITDFSSLCQKISDMYNENELTIKNTDLFTSDVLHEFELGTPKDIGRAYKSYVKLRESRQLRRKAKNENRMLLPLYDFIKHNPTLTKEMIRIKDKCNGIKYDIENASYYYRTNESTE